MYPDDAHVVARCFATADDLRLRVKRIAREDRFDEPDVGVAQIGRRIEGDVRYRAPEHDVEDQHVVHRRPLEAERPGELGGAVERPSVSGQGYVQGDIAIGDCARDRVVEDLARGEVLEEVALSRLSCHIALARPEPRSELYTTEKLWWK